MNCRRTRKEKKANRRRNDDKYSQRFITEVGWFWWVKLVQFAVNGLETIITHLSLNYYIRNTMIQAIDFVTRNTRKIVLLLLFRPTTDSSHVFLALPTTIHTIAFRIVHFVHSLPLHIYLYTRSARCLTIRKISNFIGRHFFYNGHPPFEKNCCTAKFHFYALNEL